MNSIIYSLTRFLKNKNTVTILGVILSLGILYFGYNYQLRSAVNPIKIVVANRDLTPGTRIERGDVKLIDIAPVMLEGYDIYRTENDVVGKYVNFDSTVAEGSMFFKKLIVTSDGFPNSAITNVRPGEIPYNLSVNMETTYNNSIMPGNIVDIYLKGTNETGTLMVGRLVENIRVLAIKDTSGRDVFENSTELRVPSVAIFGVEPNIHLLLRKARYLGAFGVEIFMVPRGGVLTDAEKEALRPNVSSTELRDFINRNTATLTEQALNNLPDDSEPVLPEVETE